MLLADVFSFRSRVAGERRLLPWMLMLMLLLLVLLLVLGRRTIARAKARRITINEETGERPKPTHGNRTGAIDNVRVWKRSGQKKNGSLQPRWWNDSMTLTSTATRNCATQSLSTGGIKSTRCLPARSPFLSQYACISAQVRFDPPFDVICLSHFS
jgi:hypothetical protein